MSPELQSNLSQRLVQIALASPDTIRSWSYGKVTRPETLNYKTLKPEKKGLFDEAIFGPIKNYECACGRYKKIKNKGTKCENCQVDVVESIVRRYRMGHIELEEPVAHIWMFKTLPSRIANLLGMTGSDVTDIIYFTAYVVIDPGSCPHLKSGTIIYQNNLKRLTNSRRNLIKIVQSILDKLPSDKHDFDRAHGHEIITSLKSEQSGLAIQEVVAFIRRHTRALIGTGADAILKLIKKLDLNQTIIDLEQQLKKLKTVTNREMILKRLQFLKKIASSNNQPEWMILRVLPVIPPDLRPILQLDGGRFTSSEVNDLYRRVIIRNNRLQKMKQEQAPEIMINNEKRMLQEAVDALLYNERKDNPVLNKFKTPLKSLTNVLKGKQGRFRQNLLGKRVDYSGRSVVVVGPDLRMNQCGLNREMAVAMFKPFIMREIMKQKITNNVRKASEMVDQQDQRIWKILEQVVQERPVMLNRAPTLHRLGIQGFEIVLIDGKAIQLHPLVTTAFNADFDGDQMAVHLPLTDPAVAEVRTLMLGFNSILNPKDGKPIVGPSQDMVLGIYYLTLEKKNEQGEGIVFSSLSEALLAYETDHVTLHAVIGILTTALPDKNLPIGHILVTTVGKLIFNSIFNEPFPYLNAAGKLTTQTDDLVPFSCQISVFITERSILKPFVKANFMPIIATYFDRYGAKKTALMLDQLKDLGFKFSDQSGITVSLADVQVDLNKRQIIDQTDQKVHEVQKFYDQGMLTSVERTAQIYRLWSQTKSNIQDQVSDFMLNHPTNPIFMMADSGARGNISNFTQLMGMRGFMTNPKGNIIEIPIKSSFREGLSAFEYFISTHGARKGLADVAIKTADAGYLTRRLVDVAQEVTIEMTDCNANHGFMMRAIKERNFGSSIVTLSQRISGRFLFTPIEINSVKIPAGTLISPEQADQIEQAGISQVNIYSVLTCEASTGVCVKCYGLNLTNGQLSQVGDVVGVIAAQSIGEPGTQLTLRNFHTGGVADEVDITRGLPRIKELLDVTEPKGQSGIISRVDGQVVAIQPTSQKITIEIASRHQKLTYSAPANATIRCRVGDHVAAGALLTEGAVNIKELLQCTSVETVANYILDEAQKVYNFQGIEINDKYFEIIIRQMLKRVEILNSGETELTEGQTISRQQYQQSTYQAIKAGKQPALVCNKIYGIKRAPLLVDSFLAAASFQETTRTLTEAICEGRKDYLTGLKENIILGGIIPAGTGKLTDDQIIELGLKAQVY